MGLIVAIILGALVGWAASSLFDRRYGIFGYIMIGIAGSLIGKVLTWLFTGDAHAALALEFWPLFWSFVGSLILVLLLNISQGRPNRPQL